jgi:hypothetical protein
VRRGRRESTLLPLRRPPGRPRARRSRHHRHRTVVTIDELLGPRRGPGRPPKLTHAELVCLAVAQVLPGFGSERGGCALPASGWATCFPTCPPPRPTTAGCAAPLVGLAIHDIAAHSPSWGDQLRLVDSTPVPCAGSRETVKREGERWSMRACRSCRPGACQASFAHSRRCWGLSGSPPWPTRLESASARPPDLRHIKRGWWSVTKLVRRLSSLIAAA